MILIMVSKIRNKLMLGLRLLLFGAIIIILVGQLWSIFQASKFYGSWFEENHPNGNPMRVEQPMNLKEGIIDNMVEVFKSYYYQDKQLPGGSGQ
ncbi:hypothetical protein [Desulfolucanica intricata]|uniref:hypothetical protein n=1 Tax=Desulfolucanica intricata TaxID=1285191 RepID=UPI0008312169|nr:hypothetical protein [Desulfolucanica intricata]